MLECFYDSPPQTVDCVNQKKRRIFTATVQAAKLKKQMRDRLVLSIYNNIHMDRLGQQKKKNDGEKARNRF